MSSKHPLRLCIIEPRGSGGMVHYAYQLGNALSQHITETTLVTTKKYELEAYPHQFQVVKLLDLWSHYGPRHAAQRKNGFGRFWWLIYRSIRRVLRGMRLFFEWTHLTGYLLKVKPDVVQFGTIEFPFEAIFLRYLKSKGLVLTQICHEFEPRERRKDFFTRINNSLLKNVFSAFSAIFFHSPANRQRFLELYPHIPPGRCHVIAMGNGRIFPEPADPSRARSCLMERYGLAPESKVVLFFGNVTPSKGIPDLLKAFAEVQRKNDRARLIIAGMPLKYINFNSLFEMANRLGIQPRIFFDTRYIPLEEVRPLLELATVVAFPYLSSTQSASIQAAYAAGKPVIATRVGGLPDVVEAGESGFLVDPGAPDQLAAAILKIIDDPALAEKMGRRARVLSETRFAWGPIAGNITAVYTELLSNENVN